MIFTIKTNELYFIRYIEFLSYLVWIVNKIIYIIDIHVSRMYMFIYILRFEEDGNDFFFVENVKLHSVKHYYCYS